MPGSIPRLFFKVEPSRVNKTEREQKLKHERQNTIRLDPSFDSAWVVMPTV